jgi:RNA polymerase sigma-70 factor, ECF subfamily
VSQIFAAGRLFREHYSGIARTGKIGASEVKATQRSSRLRLVEPAGAQPQVLEEPQGSCVEPAVPSARQSDAPPVPSVASAIRSLSDAQLVALGLKGHSTALETLYRRHAAFAINLAARIQGSGRDIEDVAHDAFVRAFESLADLTDPSAFRSWLGAIVVHGVRSRMRRMRLMSLLGMGRGAEPVDIDAIASCDATPYVRAQIAQVYALLRTLPTDDRIAWALRNVQGHDLETVAKLARCSLATVKRRISRTQRFLDEHFVDPDSHEGSS